MGRRRLERRRKEEDVWEGGSWERGVWERGVWERGVWERGVGKEAFRKEAFGRVAFEKEAFGLEVFGKELFGKELLGKEVTVAKENRYVSCKKFRLCWALYSLLSYLVQNIPQKIARRTFSWHLPSELASFFSQQHAPNLRRYTAKFTSTVAAYFLCRPRGTVASSKKPNARGSAVIGCLPSLAGNREGEGLTSLKLIAT
jgi:hypothetical protein